MSKGSPGESESFGLRHTPSVAHKTSGNITVIVQVFFQITESNFRTYNENKRHKLDLSYGGLTV